MDHRISRFRLRRSRRQLGLHTSLGRISPRFAAAYRSSESQTAFAFVGERLQFSLVERLIWGGFRRVLHRLPAQRDACASAARALNWFGT
jgi:hypothetical protein